MNNLNNQSNLPPTAQNPVLHLTAPKICHNPFCGFQTHEPLSKCPHCKRPMWTTNDFRALSSVLILCGLLLLAIGGGLGYIAFRNYAYTEKITDEHEIGIYFLSAISVFLSAFGISVIAAGAWQVIFGRANLRLIYILLGFIFALFAIAGVGKLAVTLLSP